MLKRQNGKLGRVYFAAHPGAGCGCVVVRGPESGGPRLPTAQADPLATQLRRECQQTHGISLPHLEVVGSPG